MKFRKVRIAWSVAWGVVTVLVCVLWVRSYWWADEFGLQVTQITRIAVQSSNGTIEAANWDVRAESGDWHFVHDELANPNDEGGLIWWGDHGALIFALEFGTDVDDDTYFFIQLPHWFYSFIIGIIAALPWLPSRFSLRMLLFATSLVAVVLGIIVWLSRVG